MTFAQIIRNLGLIGCDLSRLENFVPKTRQLVNINLLQPLAFPMPDEGDEYELDGTGIERTFLTTTGIPIDIPVIPTIPYAGCPCLTSEAFDYGADYGALTRAYRTIGTRTGVATLVDQENADQWNLCPPATISQIGAVSFNTCSINGILLRFVGDMDAIATEPFRNFRMILNGRTVYDRPMQRSGDPQRFHVELELTGVPLADRPALTPSANQAIPDYQYIPYADNADIIDGCESLIKLEAQLDNNNGGSQYARVEILKIW